MKKTVWKFELGREGRTLVKMPRGAEVLCVQAISAMGILTGRDEPYLWALVDPDAEQEERVFETYGTGHAIDAEEYRNYVGTYTMLNGALVFHVFECLGGPDYAL